MTLTRDTSIQFVKGVGEKRAALFARLNIHTVDDLLRHYPRDYEDWSQAMSIAQGMTGDTDVCVRATAITAPREHRVRTGLSLFKFKVSDGWQEMEVTIFNNKYAAAKIKAGEEYLFFGRITWDFHRVCMSSPQIERPEAGRRMRPIYPLTGGLTSRAIEKVVAAALDAGVEGLSDDWLPESLRQTYDLCGREQAIRHLHFPDSWDDVKRARRRVAFEELFLLQLGLLQLKGRSRRPTGTMLRQDATDEFCAALPFTLTGAQTRAIGECLSDMRSGHPMSRLLQGDVGSGKTAVAAAVGYSTIRNGWQVAMMAPTEILAQQHAQSIGALFEPLGVSVGLLTSSCPAEEKRRTLRGLADGSLGFVVGTQALLSEQTTFARLGLVITDEQHRFGVSQRAKLAAKGENPHMLVMSATPIPRTLALMIYGDLDVSVLDELPPGRQPIATYSVGSDKRERVYSFIKKHLDEGRQAYIVCPLVGEDGELREDDLSAATAYEKSLAEGAFRDYPVGLLHGRMKAADKQRVMEAFAAGDIGLLVATTVVEVGVDVPNAVLMVIENADRFGLAQLHQLRGRVGRGKFASTCVLITDAHGDEVRRRMAVMCRTNNGFEIADEDLRLRGPGDFFGNRQHGLPTLHVASLTGDAQLLEQARSAAWDWLRSGRWEDPAHRSLQDEVRRLFATVGENGLN
ncbi:MAG: ATP-dependent DNA helicase RecG [Clostridia bacterium]|nr:ATP-dependent DNA helicase RecG [Clostridia bacterium]